MNNLNNTNDNFDLAEQEGRRKAAKLFGTKYNYTFSDDKYSSFDVKINGLEKDSYVEIKNRNFDSTRHNTDFIEYMKLRHLKMAAKEDKMFYLCFYNDGVARMYDLKKIDITEVFISEVPMNKHTAVDSYEVNKLMIELPTSTACNTFKNIF